MLPGIYIASEAVFCMVQLNKEVFVKSFKTIFSILCVTLLLSISATAHAVEGISVNHRFMMAEEFEGSGSIATLEVTVTNAGTSSLSEVKLMQIAPFVLSDQLEQALQIDILPAGDRSTHSWKLFSSMPADQVFPIFSGPIRLSLSGIDDFGQNVNVDITSEGGAE